MQQGSIADVDDGPYDTATAFDVIEHVPDPEGFLSTHCRRAARRWHVGAHVA